MTHQELVFLAARWLEREHSCPLVFQEPKTISGEVPDVIGFFDGGDTVMIECKISRTDFLSDKHKSYRAYPEDGMGDYRFIATTNDVWRHGDTLPDNWGLIIFEDGRFHTVYEPERFELANKQGETSVLVAAIRFMGLTISPTWEDKVIKKTRPKFFGGNRTYTKYNSRLTRESERMYEVEQLKRMLGVDFDEDIDDEEKACVEEMLVTVKQPTMAEYLEWKSNLIATYNDNFPSPTGEYIVAIVMD